MKTEPVLFWLLELKMLVNKKFFALIFALLFATFYVGAQSNNKALTDRFLERANNSFDSGNMQDAFKNINGALKVCDDPIPTNVLSLAKSIYRARLKQLLDKFDEQQFIEVQSSLEEHPDVNDASLTKLVRQIEAKKNASEKANDKKEQQQFIESLKNQGEQEKKAIEDLSKVMKENAEQTKESNETLITAINEQGKQMKETNEKSDKKWNGVIILIVVIILIIMLLIGLILLIVRLSAKQSRVQQMQYAEAFKLLAQNQSQTNQLMLGGVTDIYGENGLKSAGSSRWGVDALPEPEETPEEKEEMRDLAAKCEDLGARIDQVTGRKNNSKNVSELVYKLAMKLGMRQRDAMVYFCAAMVYDAGFMSVDQELLSAEQLTEEQRKELNQHTDKAEENLQFVPRRYWQVFEDAAKWHHENMDGSGKNGLKGEKIPQIARIIRVADSFVAMSSKRSYRGGMDKDTVCDTLAEQSNIYDPDVINALKEII